MFVCIPSASFGDDRLDSSILQRPLYMARVSSNNIWVTCKCQTSGNGFLCLAAFEQKLCSWITANAAFVIKAAVTVQAIMQTNPLAGSLRMICSHLFGAAPQCEAFMISSVYDQCTTRGPFYWYGLTLIPPWISHHIPCRVWDEWLQRLNFIA